MPQLLHPNELETLSPNERKTTITSLLNASTPEEQEFLKNFYHLSIRAINKLSQQSLEALSITPPSTTPASTLQAINSFRDELHSHLLATHSNHPRKLHAILYSMGFPTDVGCG
jgi:hypothetical protein